MTTGGHDSGHGGVHEPGASQGTRGRQTQRHLGLRVRAVRDAHGEARLRWRGHDRRAGRGRAARARLEGRSVGRDACRSHAVALMSCEGPAATRGRHVDRLVRAREHGEPHSNCAWAGGSRDARFGEGREAKLAANGRHRCGRAGRRSRGVAGVLSTRAHRAHDRAAGGSPVPGSTGRCRPRRGRQSARSRRVARWPPRRVQRVPAWRAGPHLGPLARVAGRTVALRH